MNKESHSKMKINGKLQMVIRDKTTNEIVDSFEDHNVVLLEGKQVLLSLLVEGAVSPGLKSIAIGSDVGSGTIMSPEMANENLTSSSQTVVYESTADEWTVTYPTPESVRFLAAMDGAKIMALYPTVPNVVYTSATLRFGTGESFAYRRFNPRTISEYVYVDIIWTVSIN